MTDERNILTVLTSGLLAFFAPIAGNIFAMFWVFLVNFLIGLTVGIVVQKEDFNNAKALRCMGEAVLFFLLAASIYICGSFNGNMEAAIQCLSYFVYVILFFYGRNVLKNLRRVLKEGSTPWYVVDFLYKVASFEFVKLIPGLSDYARKNETAEQE